MKEFFDVTLLALLQGVAEFLPISSSGHLVLLQDVLNVPEALRMRLEVFLHAGTMLSVFVFYWQRISSLLGGIFGRDPVRRVTSWLFSGKLLVSTIPAVIVYFLFKDQIEGLTANVRMVGALLMFTGAVLIGTRFMPRGSGSVGWRSALLMGVAQAVALLPGVSRSGMTLTAARGARISPESSAEFSFLMSAPLICGGVLLECVKGEVSTGGMSPLVLGWGTLLAAVVGYFSLVWLVRLLQGRWFWLFGPYCLLAGLITIIFC